MAQPFPIPASADPGEGKWSVRTDDFSVQVSLPGDPKFWVRVETGGIAPLVISDLKRADQEPPTVADALGLAVSTALEGRWPQALQIKDIVPGKDREDAEAEAALLALCLVPFADTYGARIEQLAVVPRRDKFDLMVRLAPKQAQP